MKYDIVTLGTAAYDLFVRPEKERIIRLSQADGHKDYLAFPHGAKLEIDDIHKEFGGGASNVAVHVSKMGLKSAACCCIGDDYYGKEILKNFKKNKVDVTGVQVCTGDSSSFSIVLHSFDGERTVFHARGIQHVIPVKQFIRMASVSRQVHITSLPDKSDDVFTAFTKFFKKNKRVRVSWNPGSTQLARGAKFFKKFLSCVDTLFLNKDELEEFVDIIAPLYDKNTLHQVLYDFRKGAKKLLDMGVKRVIITDGKRGAQLFHKSNKKIAHHFVAAYAGKLVSTLGAGDAFSAGFIIGMIYFNDSNKALQCATANAGAVVSRFGAQNGTLSYSHMVRSMRMFPVIDLTQ